nr:hypothetical protein [Tanacetum cinerariifolium]
MTVLVDEHLDAGLRATRDEFMNFLSASITARIIEQVKSQLPQILPEEKRKTSKDAEPTKGPKAKESQSGSFKGTKSQPKSSRKSAQSEEPEFEVVDSDLPQNQEGNLGNDDEPMEETTKAAQYDLLSIEDMVLNIWSPVKVAYDKHALLGISHWRDQLTWVEIMRKHRYGYLKEIKVRRADYDLCTFKEGDFPRLRINDIEDMLLLVIQNRLTNLSIDDVSNFAIALRMFTRSITNDNGSTFEKLVSEDIINDEGNAGTVEEGVDSLLNEDMENFDKVMVWGSNPE